MPAHSLADKVRSKLRTGALPRDEPLKLWTGYGTEQKCVCCDAPILRRQVEYEPEMPDGRRFKMHIGCHGLWVAERMRCGSVPPSPGCDSPKSSPRLGTPTQRLAKQVRGKLISGALPLQSPKGMRGGYGTRRSCAVCETIIREAEVEYEVAMPGGGELFMHMRCHSAWMTERIRLGFAEPPDPS